MFNKPHKDFKEKLEIQIIIIILISHGVSTTTCETIIYICRRNLLLRVNTVGNAYSACNAYPTGCYNVVRLK